MSAGAGEAAGRRRDDGGGRRRLELLPRPGRVAEANEDIDDALDDLVSTVDDLVRDLTPEDAVPTVAPGREPERVAAGVRHRREPRARAPLSRGVKVAVMVAAILLVVVIEYVILGGLLGQG